MNDGQATGQRISPPISDQPGFDPSREPLWAELGRQADRLRQQDVADLFVNDPERLSRFGLTLDGLHLDFSKQLWDAEVLTALLGLVERAGVVDWRRRMQAGEPINSTEGRAVLHMALRAAREDGFCCHGEPVQPQIEAVLARMERFVASVRAGSWPGHSGESLTDVVNIGIGGSDLGPRLVCRALAHLTPAPGLRTHFVANVAPDELSDLLAGLDPRRTLFIIASKTFSTQETMANAHAARAWLVEHFKGEESAVARHFVAVSTHLERVQAFGIDPANMFEFWDWVGGRYSLWSAIGLPIALQLGMDGFRQLLAGARAMDRHFLEAEPARNAPVLMALAGIWNTNFLGAESLAVVPYAPRLRLLPDFLQQLEMESNGKSVRRDGAPVNLATCPVVWGNVGTNGQHAFFEMLHQGPRRLPVDFIAVAEAPTSQPLDRDGEDRQRMLLANVLAQASGLMQGRHEADLAAEGVLPALWPHKRCPGNRPSTFVLLQRLDAFSLGQLLALYEHKVFVQGVIWGLNSFDQWGVELGKAIADSLLPVLAGESATGLDPSTADLVARIRAWQG